MPFNEFDWFDLTGAFISGFIIGVIAKCMFRCTVPQYEIDIEDNDGRNNS